MTHFQSHLHNLTPDSKKVLVNSLTFRKHENHNIHNSDLYKEKFWLFQSFFSLCVYMNTWQTTLGTLFIIYSYSLADCTKNPKEHTLNGIKLYFCTSKMSPKRPLWCERKKQWSANLLKNWTKDLWQQVLWLPVLNSLVQIIINMYEGSQEKSQTHCQCSKSIPSYIKHTMEH